MKKKMVSVLMAAAMMTSLAACGSSNQATQSTENAQTSEAAQTATEQSEGGSEAASEAAAGEEISVSVIFKTLASEHWQLMKAGVEAYTADHPNVTADIKGPSAETMYDEQVNMITTDLATASFDGYLIAPLQSESAAQLIQQTDKPVIALDTNMKTDQLASFVGTGNEAAAKQGAEIAVAQAKEIGWEEIKCIEIAGVQGDETNTARMNGFRAGVEENGGDFLDDEIQYANATADLAVTAMEGIMSKYPDGVAIICANNDDMALAAAKTAASNPAYDNTVFLGFDGSSAVCQAIADGEYKHLVTIAQNPYQMGYMGMEAMVKSLQGEKLDEFIDSGVTVITKENAADRVEEIKGYLR